MYNQGSSTPPCAVPPSLAAANPPSNHPTTSHWHLKGQLSRVHEKKIILKYNLTVRIKEIIKLSK